MAPASNPFGAPLGAPAPAAPGGNPFDPFSQALPAIVQPPQAVPGQFTPGQPPPPQQQPPQTAYQQPPQQQMQQNFQQQQQQMQSQLQYTQQQPPFPQATQQNALVPSRQQSNPYAGVVAPQPAADPFGNYQQQALVPAPQAASPWASQPQTQAPSPAANQFDPFAVAPPPPPAPAPAAPAPDPFPIFAAEAQQSPPQQQQQHQQQALVPLSVPGPSPYALAPAPQPDPYGQSGDQSWRQAGEGSTSNVGNNEMVPYAQNEGAPYVKPEPQLHHVNKYSTVLAGQAPPNSAPLPQGERVLKSGYVLSRISFRTILLKKWKQSYWVQYGPHTMLWFRNYSDFDDWLNNPYHTQQQRNYLIKLAVNFVHDLYKPNVRGYQVTQARSKPYRNKILRQFKLERWMDYGPTIAAAFASSDPKEVDALRQAIVECMRNTPVGEGIRATGAVRQDDSPAALGNDGAHREQGGYHNAGGTSRASTGEPVDDHRGFDDNPAPGASYPNPPRQDSSRSAPYEQYQQQPQQQYQQQPQSQHQQSQGHYQQQQSFQTAPAGY